MAAERTQPDMDGWAGCAIWMMCAVLAVAGAIVGEQIGHIVKTDIWGSASVGFMLGVVAGTGAGIVLFCVRFISLKDVKDCALFSAFMGIFNGVIGQSILFAALDKTNPFYALTPLDLLLSVLIIVFGTFLFVMLEGLLYKVWQKSWIAAVPLILASGAVLGSLLGYGFSYLAGLGASLVVSGVLVGLLPAIAVATLLVYDKVHKPVQVT